MIFTLDSLTQIIEHLHQGELVAIPTETVYGLAADARNPIAIEKIFDLKGRPKNRPLSILLADKNQVKDWALSVPETAWKLAEAFWPGPLTLIVPKAGHVSDLITANQSTIGLRVPAHPVALAVLEAFGGALAAPSANPFNQPSPTTATQVAEYFPHDLWIVDGGVTDFGLASTIVDCTVTPPVILRAGVITAEEIFANLV